MIMMIQIDTSILGSLIKNKESTCKDFSRTLRLKFHHPANPIMRNLIGAMTSEATARDLRFGGFTTTPNSSINVEK